MGSSWVLIGASVVGALSLYLFIKLLEISKNGGRGSDDGIAADAERRQDPLTTFFALFCLATFFFSMFLVSKAAYDEFDYCYLVVENSTVAGSLTSYDYSRECFDNTNSTADNFMKLTNYLLIMACIFLLIAMIWNVFLYVKSLFQYDE